MTTTVLLEQRSPHGNLDAVVQIEDGAVYFYLFPVDQEAQSGLRSVWVRNGKPAPSRLDVEAMRRGHAPLLPAPYCAHPSGAPPPAAEDLSVVWFPEGDGAALIERSEWLAILPAWSGQIMDGQPFHGYAKGCTAISPLAWPLEDTTEMQRRIDGAIDFWDSWAAEPPPWKETQKAILSRYEAQYGSHTKYYAIDNGYWPPQALVRFQDNERVRLLTLGVSQRPQPLAEMYAQDPAALQFIELAFHFSAQAREELIDACAEYLSGQAKYPWSKLVFLGEGHSMPCDAFAADNTLREFDHVLFVRSRPSPLQDYRNDTVNVLYGIPITRAERDFAEKEGSEPLARRLPGDVIASGIVQPRQPVV